MGGGGVSKRRRLLQSVVFPTLGRCFAFSLLLISGVSLSPRARCWSY